MLIESIISALTSIVNPAAILRDELKRNETVIKLLKKFNLDPEQPPKDFAGVYSYTLVEYGIGKPLAILKVFRHKKIQAIFQQAFENNQPQLLFQEVESFLARDLLGQQLRAEGINWQRELAEFMAIFLTVAKRTRTPSEVLASQKLDSLHRTLSSLQQDLASLPTAETVRQEVAKLLGQGIGGNYLVGVKEKPCQVRELAEQLRVWFETLGYGFEGYEVWEEDYFSQVITVPARRGYDRILVRGVAGEAGLKDLVAIGKEVQQQRCDEGWLVSARRISQAVRKELERQENSHLFAYTFDELLEDVADFSRYLDWLGEEVQSKSIDRFYVPLGCTKEEIDPETQQRLGVSSYGEEDGWIEGYVDLWLSDPAKEHLSVLGEFGTGKTWFALHYAWVALQKYQEAKRKGLPRPRLPLVIPLRDYAKAVSVESLFSEFFFRKYEIPIPGYSAFEQLNRMGKLLLIFDGFDEMAARVDRQAMINNFWELAKVVVPGSKVILTCRTEHFPEAKQGRALLNAELRSSVANLTAESPQFEVLELNKFDDEQIRQVFSFQAQEATVEQIMGNQQLLDLSRRPVMTDLILEALPDIEKGKPVDMARVYLYAVRRKMERDIKAERTFTSLADKMYFLCELAWEMLSTDQMSLNYRLFPDRIRKLFDIKVQEEKDLDHWHYDMMGQTMLVRNSEGNYSPAHRSLLEFFVAYKLAAELGVLAEDFLEVVRQQSDLDEKVAPQSYGWREYFQRRRNSAGEIVPIAGLKEFRCESLQRLRGSLGLQPLAKAVWDLLVPMVDGEKVSRLLDVVEGTQGKTEEEVGHVGGNAATLLLKVDKEALEGRDLSHSVLVGGDFTVACLRGVNFTKAKLNYSIFPRTFPSAWSVAFSNDGKYLATGHVDGIIRLWDLSNSQQIKTLKGHTSGVNSVCFNPHDETIVSSSDDKTVRIWNINTGQCLKIFRGHLGFIRSVTANTDMQILASGSDDGTVLLWDINTGQCLNTLLGHNGSVRSVVFSPDDKILVSGGDDHTVKLWSVDTGQCINTLLGHNGSVRSVAFSSDGNKLASGSFDRTVRLWDAYTHKCIKTLQKHTERVRAIVFSPNAQIIASASFDKTVRIWNVSTGQCIRTLQGHINWLRAVAFSPDSQILASSGDDQAIRLWNVHTGECLKTLQGLTHWIFSVAFSPNGAMLVSGGDKNSIKLWNTKTSQYIKSLRGHTNWLESVVFCPNGKVVASSSEDQTIKLWNVDTGECLKTLREHLNVVGEVTFSSDGKMLASASDDQSVKLWDVATGRCLKILKHSGRICSVAFSPDDQTLVSGSSDQKLKLWNVLTGQCLKVLEGHSSWVTSVAFNPNGQTIISGSGDKTIRLWKYETGECLSVFRGHTGWIWSVAFSHNGVMFASGSSDKTVRLWEIGTSQCLTTLQGHQNWIRSVTFSPNEVTLASGSYDESIKIWDIKTGQCLKTLSNKPYANMNITGVKGLSPDQINSLKALGAVEN